MIFNPKQQIEDFIAQKLSNLASSQQLRTLSVINPSAIDFASNDYLGLAREGIELSNPVMHGASGSRLLTGNTRAMLELEEQIAAFHQSEAALIFGSGYEANIGLISTLIDREAILIYDAKIHRSIRDASRIALGTSFAFRHNDLEDLERKLKFAHLQKSAKRLFVSVESLYSIDGDLCPLKEIIELCEKYGALLLIDEAHSTGIFGEKGQGLVHALGFNKQIFARVHTFGKALGLCGAVILGSDILRKYLINKASSYIYTTALPSGLIDSIAQAYRKLEQADNSRKQLNLLIQYFIQHFSKLNTGLRHSLNPGPIQSIFMPNTHNLLQLSQYLNKFGFLLLPIRHPTVAKDQECLRLCLHAFNTTEQIDNLSTLLVNFHHHQNLNFPC